MKLHKTKERLDVNTADISGSAFDNVNFSGCNFHNVNLAGATFDKGSDPSEYPGSAAGAANRGHGLAVQCPVGGQIVDGNGSHDVSP